MFVIVCSILSFSLCGIWFSSVTTTLLSFGASLDDILCWFLFMSVASHNLILYFYCGFLKILPRWICNSISIASSLQFNFDLDGSFPLFSLVLLSLRVFWSNLSLLVGEHVEWRRLTIYLLTSYHAAINQPLQHVTENIW